MRFWVGTILLRLLLRLRRLRRLGWRLSKNISGHTISDSYRWLEDSDSAETQEFVRAELAYTRGVLDPLPGRNQINQKLTELLSIGNIGTPQVGGKYYFYVRRDGKQNQAVLLVREGVHGKDRTLVDRISCLRMARLRWTGGRLRMTENMLPTARHPAGRKRARCESLRLRAGNCCPMHRSGAACQRGVEKDDSGFYYGRTPKKGDVPAGEEVYHVKIFYHALGSDPKKIL